MENVKKKEDATVKTARAHDPYAIRSIEQLLALFDSGHFQSTLLDGHRNLQKALIDHRDEYGSKGCKGAMTITVNYALGQQGDVSMSASASFAHPKPPSSSATAFIDESGQMTLYSPLMAKMRGGVRDVGHDPITGEIRDL